MKKIFALFEVYKKGNVVANPTAWKNGQITASVIAGLLAALIALAKVYGYDLPLTDDQLVTIGSAILAIAGLFINTTATIVSSDKVGLSTVNDINDKGNSPIPGH